MRISFSFTIGWLMLLFSCGSKQDRPVELTLENTAGIDLIDKAVVIKRSDLPLVKDGGFQPLVINAAGDTITAQVDDTDGDGNWDELFFITNIQAGKQEKFHLTWSGEHFSSVPRSHIRFGVRQTRESHVEKAMSDTFYADQLPGVIGYQHYQTDGPTWENDKVGFRIYLDGRNSIDVFGKKVQAITSDSIGIGRDGATENNYSEMKDWGMDILGVGNSVGIGGIALQIQDSLARLGVTEKDSLNNVDTTIYRIFSNGPVRSLMEFDYRHWRPLNRDYRVKSQSRIWPGMYAFENTVKVENLKGDETLLVGLVNSNTTTALTEVILNDNWVALLTHDKQSINKQWYLGLAIILPRKYYNGFMEAPTQGKLSNSFLGKLKVTNNTPVTYYAVAAWELSDKRFSDAAGFLAYVRELAAQLDGTYKTTINQN